MHLNTPRWLQAQFMIDISEQRTMKQTFSATLDSKDQLKNISLTEDLYQKVFIEADLGKLKQVVFTDGLLLEVVGTKGVLRIDMPIEALRKAIR